MGPLSGVLIAHFNWRWMFVLEGIPALLLLIPWLLLIDDKPLRPSGCRGKPART